MSRIRTSAKAAAVLGAAACLAALAGPQALAAPSRSSDAPTALVMTVADGTPDALTNARSVLLLCNPVTGGDHPAAATACDNLRTSAGSLTATPTLQTFCMNVHQPVTVLAEGIWQGQPVSYQQTYDNRCLMLRATGELFDF
ncbi:SSI family serine proteinase inhibitor [Kitasatospora sp. LaBMicrA B282]|uniref:SSI family serine proteinase inhibitor n=1 Tax=Kitasatospora sp. LaBMicrA B282 TaxID=3420949 RepID=UPI003D11C624